jgi:guanylate kinase
MPAEQKLVIITAPSGSGKTTIVNHLLKEIPQLSFSVSACTRPSRVGETDGVNYYFISVDEFQNKIQEQAFAEYEMVYPGKYYGTLKSELQRIWQQQQFPLIDIDVHGAMRLKTYYGAQALSLFIKAPSVEELERRLRKRGTESEESLKERLDKAAHELSFADKFDQLLVNDDLQRACAEAAHLIRSFLLAE